MAIDKGFRRIALSLMTLITISVITVGVYLYFNFKSRSSLPVIVPQDVRAFMHFQTRKMRDESGVKPPKYLDSVVKLIAKAPIFQHLTEPSDAGIGLYSDIVYFENLKQSHFLGLSLINESRFSRLLDTLKLAGWVSGQIQKPAFNYVKVIGHPLYIAFKYKAMVLMRSEIESRELNLTTDEVESQLAEVFSGKPQGFITRKDIQALYDANCQWLAWSESTSAAGIHFEKGNATLYLSKGNEVLENASDASGVFMRLGPSNWGISPEKISAKPLEIQRMISKSEGPLEYYFEGIFKYLQEKGYAY